MPRPKKGESVRLQVVLEKAQADRVGEMARLMSVKEKRTITVSEAIRMAIKTAYPVPAQLKQADMFKGSNKKAPSTVDYEEIDR